MRASSDHTGKVDAKGKFYVAEFRSRLRRPLVATKPNFGGAFEGLHPSLPLNGQIVISTDLQEATAEECDGQQFPAERCEQTLPVRKMEFSPMGTPWWAIDVKTPPLANVRCLDYVQRTTGVEHLTQVYGRANGSLRAKMLRGKNFKLSGNVTQPWGNGTLRLSWTLTFTRMR